MTQKAGKGCALITGAGGRLGSLLRAARRDATDLKTRFVFQSRDTGSDIRWSPGENPDALPKCELLIALWGVTSGTEEDLNANAILVQATNEVAGQIGARKVVHISTAGVYGPGENLHEDSPLRTYSDYGKSKIKMEEEVALQRSAADQKHVCIRLANVVGADSLANALRRPGPAKIDNFSTDEITHQGPVRSYIGAGDLLHIFDELNDLPETKLPEILNVACPEPISMEDLIFAADKDVIWRPAPAAATSHVTLDVTRLKALFPTLDFMTNAQALVAEWKRLESYR